MGNALELQECHNTQSTAKFTQTFGPVFDCLKVSRLNQDKKGKREGATYESVNDWCFEVKIEIRVSWKFFKSC